MNEVLIFFDMPATHSADFLDAKSVPVVQQVTRKKIYRGAFMLILRA